MKNKQPIVKDKDQKIYKTVEEALDAKHDLAKKFLAKIDTTKIATLGQKL
ncbi:hypothetical protein [Emticicia sp. W12TSBA100-4]